MHPRALGEQVGRGLIVGRFGCADEVAIRRPIAHDERVIRRALLLTLALTACVDDAAAPQTPPPHPAPDVGVVEAPAELPPTPAKADEVPAIVPTDLPLVLMATMVAEDPTRGRATVRDEERGAITTYSVGDAVRPGATITAVDRDFVVLTREDGEERLDFPEEPTPMTGREVFYPDFIDLDARANSMDEVVQLQPGIGYVLKRPTNAWGTPRTLAAIQSAVKRYLDRGLGGPDVHIGDISLKSGGPFPPHLSHQDGRDVDVGYVLEGEAADIQRFVTATRGRLDVVRSWALLEAFLDTERVRYVFVDYGLQRLLYEYALRQGVDEAKLGELFQYPRGSAAARGVIRHWRGHANHFHVRFER